MSIWQRRDQSKWKAGRWLKEHWKQRETQRRKNPMRQHCTIGPLIQSRGRGKLTQERFTLNRCYYVAWDVRRDIYMQFKGFVVFTCESKTYQKQRGSRSELDCERPLHFRWIGRFSIMLLPRGLYLDSIFSELITKTEGCQSRRRHVHQLKTFAIFSYRTQKEIINCLLSGSLSGRVRIP